MALDKDVKKALGDAAIMTAAKSVVESIGGILADELKRQCAAMGIEVEAKFDVTVTGVNPDTLRRMTERKRRQ